MMGVALLLEDLAPVFLREGRTKAGTSIKSASGLFACGDMNKTVFVFDRNGVCCRLEVWSFLETGEDLKCPNDVPVGLSSDGCLE